VASGGKVQTGDKESKVYPAGSVVDDQGQLLVQFKCLVVLPICIIFTCIFYDYVCFMANK